MFPPPRHGHRDRPKDLVPTGPEDAADLLPTEALRPPRKEPHIGGGELVLAVRPRHRLDGDTTVRAIDSSHHVEKEHAQTPERDELEAARRQPVVHAPERPAPGALRSVAPMRRDRG